MDDTMKQIERSLFGGYNRKSVDEYLDELQSVIVELQVQGTQAEKTQEQQKAELAKAQSSYAKLCGRSKEQAEVIQSQKEQIKRQENERKVNEEIIKTLKGKVQARSDTIRRQEAELQRQQEKAHAQEIRLQEQQQEMDAQKEALAKLKTAYEKKEARIALLDRQLRASRDMAASLEDKLEKYQWLQEEFFKNRDRATVSRLERFLQDHFGHIRKP